MATHHPLSRELELDPSMHSSRASTRDASPLVNHEAPPLVTREAPPLVTREAPQSPSVALPAAAESPRAVVAGLPDVELIARLSALIEKERKFTAAVLLHLAEVDHRGLYLAEGCSSLFAYCVQRLGFSEDVAYKRVGAARYGRRFPLALDLVAKGALHLSALMLIGPHLTDVNHRDWLMAAVGKSKREVEQLVATRSPKPDVPVSVRKLPERHASSNDASVAGRIPKVQTFPSGDANAHCATQPNAVDTRTIERPRVLPLSGCTYRITFTAGEALKQKLDRARELCSHSIAPADLPTLIARAIDLLIAREEQRRYAVPPPKSRSDQRRHASRSATQGPANERLSGPAESAISNQRESVCIAVAESQQEPDPVGSAISNQRESVCIAVAESQREPDPVGSAMSNQRESVRIAVAESQREPDHSAFGTADIAEPRCVSRSDADPHVPARSNALTRTLSRHVPVAVRRAVWARDGGQCTFVDGAGNRCRERRFLEIDHIVALAHGGPTTIANCRLLCRAHNLHSAKLAFGAEFIHRAKSYSKTRAGGH